MPRRNYHRANREALPLVSAADAAQRRKLGVTRLLQLLRRALFELGMAEDILREHGLDPPSRGLVNHAREDVRATLRRFEKREPPPSGR